MPLPRPLPQRNPNEGPLVRYLNDLAASGDEGEALALHAVNAVKRIMQTDDGAILLDLLVKSTELFFLPPTADPRACDALNAQRFVSLDLKRIASDYGPPSDPRRKPAPR